MLKQVFGESMRKLENMLCFLVLTCEGEVIKGICYLILLLLLLVRFVVPIAESKVSSELQYFLSLTGYPHP